MINEELYDKAFNLIDKSYEVKCPELYLYDEIDSTNNVIEQKANEGWQEGIVAIAKSQSAGQGRSGRTFHSPDGGNLYMSFLVRPKDISILHLLTPAAAVATLRAIKVICNKEVTIKWVNDLYYNSLKVSGMIAKGYKLDKPNDAFVVIGIGVNVHDSSKDIPNEVKGIYGSLYGFEEKSDDGDELIANLAAKIYAEYMTIYHKLLNGERDFMNEYRTSSFIIGRTVSYISGDKISRIDVLDIDDDGKLVVKCEDGQIRKYMDGEVRITLN